MRRECFIEDGYTEQAYLKPIPQLIDCPIRFTFRPCMSESRAKILEAVRSKPADTGERTLAKALAEHVQSWSITRPARKSDAASETDGVPVPIKPESFLRLKPIVMSRMCEIVIYGTDGGDVDPDWSSSQKEDFDETLEFSVLARNAAIQGDEENPARGKVFSDIREENNEKN